MSAASDIYIRNVEPTRLAAFRNSARIRGLTHAQYLAKLYALHQDARKYPDRSAGELLRALELGDPKE